MRIITRFTACVAGLVLLQGCTRTPPGTTSGGAQGSTAQTGATGSVSGNIAEQQQLNDVATMLQGRVAGLQVIRSSDGGISLRIRGNTRVTDPNTGQAYSETEPLLVIDGMAVSSGGISQALRALDPHDIANIQVLKDVSSTSGYGIRGANGVILITTKKR